MRTENFWRLVLQPEQLSTLSLPLNPLSRPDGISIGQSARCCQTIALSHWLVLSEKLISKGHIVAVLHDGDPIAFLEEGFSGGRRKLDTSWSGMGQGA